MSTYVTSTSLDTSGTPVDSRAASQGQTGLDMTVAAASSAWCLLMPSRPSACSALPSSMSLAGSCSLAAYLSR